jgi:hypothetical protein
LPAILTPKVQSLSLMAPIGRGIRIGTMSGSDRISWLVWVARGQSFARFPDGGTRFSSAYHEWSFEMVHDAALAHSRHIHPAALPPRLNPALSQLHAFRAFEQIPWEWFAGDDVAKK